MSKSTNTIAPSRRGRKGTTSKPRAAAASPSPRSAGDALLDELKDWHARAMALPFRKLDVPEYLANFNCRAVAQLVGFHLQHVEGWSQILDTATPGHAPRGMESTFGFVPGIKHPSGEVTQPMIHITLRESEPLPQEWRPEELAILLRAKASATALRAKRWAAAGGESSWPEESARRSESDADFCEAWEKRQSQRVPSKGGAR